MRRIDSAAFDAIWIGPPNGRYLRRGQVRTRALSESERESGALAVPGGVPERAGRRGGCAHALRESLRGRRPPVGTRAPRSADAWHVGFLTAADATAGDDDLDVLLAVTPAGRLGARQLTAAAAAAGTAAGLAQQRDRRGGAATGAARRAAGHGRGSEPEANERRHERQQRRDDHGHRG
eukprot:539671-Prymnesium_polylepis.1